MMNAAGGTPRQARASTIGRGTVSLATGPSGPPSSAAAADRVEGVGGAFRWRCSVSPMPQPTPPPLSLYAPFFLWDTCSALLGLFKHQSVC
jgi:hypothetical protein